MKILRSRLLDIGTAKAGKIAQRRSPKHGRNRRSKRADTNLQFSARAPDGSSIGLTLYQLAEVMEGKIDEIVNGLQAHYQMEALKAQGLVGERPNGF